MNRLLSLILVLAAPLLVGAAQKNATGLERVRGTKVRLAVPEGFAPAADFPGYLHEDSGSSIMVTEIPGPYPELAKAYKDRSGLKKKGIKLVSSTKRKMGEHEGMVLVLEQQAGGADVRKSIWIFGTEKESVFVMGTVHAVHEKGFFKTVEKCVHSSVWDLGLAVDPFEGLGFELGDTQGLKFWTRIGDMVAFTEDGKADMNQTGKKQTGKKQTGKLKFMMGPSFVPGPIEDREAFAVERVKALPFDGLEIESKEEIELDGLDGFAVTALATKGKKSSLVYAVILFEKEKYWIGVGDADAKKRKTALAKFQKIAKSFRRIDPKKSSPKKEAK